MTTYLHVWHGVSRWVVNWGPIFALAAVCLVSASVLLSFAWEGIRTLRRRRHDRLDRLIHAEQARIDRIIMHARSERFHGGDVGHCGNCLIGRDDDYLPIVIPCREHKPAGRHHATAPVYEGEPVVGGYDYDEWVETWNRKYSQ